LNLEKLKELEKKIYNEIPMTRLMELKLVNIDDKYFKTSAPLDINVNDKGSAFGGSLSSIAIISSWCLSKLISDELGFENVDILVIKNHSSFKKQVTNDIVCLCTIPTQKDINILKEKLKTKESASLKIHAKIVQDDETRMDYEGIYVIKKR